VNGVITAHDLHQFILNPKFRLQYVTKIGRAQNKVFNEYWKWKMKDLTLSTWLISTLPDGVLPRILGRKHAFQVWEKGRQILSSLLNSWSCQLGWEIKNKSKLARFINEYLIRINVIVVSLNTSIYVISDHEHVDTILKGLSDEPNSFVMLI